MLSPLRFARRWSTLVLISGIAACGPSVPDDVTLAVTNVHVVSMSGEQVLEDRTVLISGERIAGILEGTPELDDGIEVVDGSGGYLIPGLWDMHVHALNNADAFFPEFLRFGVTGIRDMGTFVDSLHAVRQRVEAGDLVGPELVAAGPLLDGPRHQWSHAIAWHLESDEDVPELFEGLQAADVDFLKMYNAMPRDAYLAMAEMANEANVQFAGHIPFEITAEEASNLGQASLEHAGLDITTLDCIENGGNRLRGLLGVWGAEGYDAYLNGQLDLVAERGTDCINALYQTYQANNTYVTPTIVNTMKDSSTINWDVLDLLDEGARQACIGTIGAFADASAEVLDRYYGLFLDDIKALHDAGVPLLAGTDVANPCLAAGASIHDELSRLVDAGLTPFEVLQTATVNPARFLGIESDLGTVEQGKVANLVLLRSDPLQDISNTRTAHTTILRGSVVSTN